MLSEVRKRPCESRHWLCVMGMFLEFLKYSSWKDLNLRNDSHVFTLNQNLWNEFLGSEKEQGVLNATGADFKTPDPQPDMQNDFLRSPVHWSSLTWVWAEPRNGWNTFSGAITHGMISSKVISSVLRCLGFECSMLTMPSALRKWCCLVMARKTMC